MDPTELGMNLAAMKCPKCKSGDVLPLNPTNLKTDFECQDCHEVLEPDKVSLFQTFQNLYGVGLSICRKVLQTIFWEVLSAERPYCSYLLPRQALAISTANSNTI